MTLDERILSLRMDRQRLHCPAGQKAYDELFRKMSPVATVYWCCPGMPPILAHRAAFDDADYNFHRRAARRIVKGRFQNGGIAYIDADEWELFAGVYRKEPPVMDNAQRTVLEIIEREGPVTIRGIKEMTGLLAKEIAPLLHKLQQAFLVFEDQADSEWDRGWYSFSREFPQVDIRRYTRQQAMALLIDRFAELMVWFDADMIRSFYRFAAKENREALESLQSDGMLCACPFDGAPGYIRPQDRELLESEELPPACGTLVLHRNDFLVKAYEARLKARQSEWMAGRPAWDILYYILIDGEFQGAVVGKFHNGPFEVEDIALSLSAVCAQKRREEILSAVRRVCDPQPSSIRRYCGAAL